MVSWIKLVRDLIFDPKERASWQSFLVLRWLAFGAYLAVIALVVAQYKYGWLSQSWPFIITSVICGLLIVISCLKSFYPAADAEDVKAGLDKLQKDWDRASEEYKTRLTDLQTRIDQILAEGKKPRLIVVSWPGYTQQSIVEGFEDFKVSSVIYVRGIDRATRFSVDGELPDVLIVDIELQKLAAENEQLLRLDWEQELTEAYHNISPAIMALKEVEPATFLPLRVGINSLAFSKRLWGKQPPIGYSALFDRDECPLTAGADSIGIWNWYLPTMLVLFLAIGKKPNDIVDLDFTDTRNLLDELWQKLEGCNFMTRITAFYNQVDSLITDVEHGRVSLVPAGGGWTFRPSGYHGPDYLVGTVVPKEGALVWLEGAVVLKKDQVRNRHAVQFLKKLLGDEAQKSICLTGVYGGCAVNIHTIHDFAKEEYLKRRSDCENLFTQDFSRFEDNIYVRKLPKQHKQWEAWWDRFVEVCQTQYHATMK